MATERGAVETAAGGGDVWPPAGWLTNRQTAERLGIGIETLVSNWAYRDTFKAAARTVRKPGGGRCNLYPADLVERIVAEREAAGRAIVPDGCVDGDGAAAIPGSPGDVEHVAVGRDDRNRSHLDAGRGEQRPAEGVRGARDLYGAQAYQNFPDGVDARLAEEAAAAAEPPTTVPPPAEPVVPARWRDGRLDLAA
ncbi:MAG TPA: hypothetical protein VK324_08870 [Tepidisphaeraceae bacterium]|nr:hypothetical protein [Tepidisphaeraceae bacterium]